MDWRPDYAARGATAFHCVEGQGTRANRLIPEREEGKQPLRGNPTQNCQNRQNNRSNRPNKATAGLLSGRQQSPFASAPKAKGPRNFCCSAATKRGVLADARRRGWWPGVAAKIIGAKQRVICGCQIFSGPTTAGRVTMPMRRHEGCLGRKRAGMGSPAELVKSAPFDTRGLSGPAPPVVACLSQQPRCCKGDPIHALFIVFC